MSVNTAVFLRRHTFHMMAWTQHVMDIQLFWMNFVHSEEPRVPFTYNYWP